MTKSDAGNFISEWFGHRIYPSVVSTAKSLADQKAQLCPFLTAIKGQDQSCVKNEKSKGVCTISTCSNGPRQDWVACPYRILNPDLVASVGRRLYDVDASTKLLAVAAPTLAEAAVRKSVKKCLATGGRAFVYFDQKIGGEISLSGTVKSPEMAFDVTLVELKETGEKLSLGQFAILEVQTMDFHGSYGRAVGKLKNALDLHPKSFPKTLSDNLWWAGDGIEGPNIANVFKRTFYQMMFKFGFGESDACAGTALTIPAAVWDSWQPFLAAPELHELADGTFRLSAPGGVPDAGAVSAWIYVVDFDASSPVTPSPMNVVKQIGVATELLSSFALKAAPVAAAEQLLSATGIYASLLKRLGGYWPGEIQAS